MPDRYYDARTADARFRVQYPHVSGHYAVLDAEKAGLVAVGYEGHALGMAEALNAAVDPKVDEVDLVTALREVNTAHQWRVMEHLAHLVRDKMEEGFEPALDVTSLDALEDSDADHRITEALMVAIYPKPQASILNVLEIDLLENPNDALKMVPDEQKWRVSLTLARLFRHSVE
jgi:hypothetical protein